MRIIAVEADPIDGRGAISQFRAGAVIGTTSIAHQYPHKTKLDALLWQQ